MLTKKNVHILVATSLMISFSLVAIRLHKDSQRRQKLQKLQEIRNDRFLRETLIGQMDDASNSNYILVEKFKNRGWDEGMEATYEGKTYQEMVDFIRNAELSPTIYDYRIQTSIEKKEARVILMGRPWSDSERDYERNDGRITNRHRIKSYSTAITEDSAKTLVGKLSRADKKKDFTVFWTEEITESNQERGSLSKTVGRNRKSHASGTMKQGIVGRWLEVVPNLPEYNQIISIRRTNSGYVMERQMQDSTSGSSAITEYFVEGQRRFKSVGITDGEYYVIDSSGGLQMYDLEGYIRTAQPIKP